MSDLQTLFPTFTTTSPALTHLLSILSSHALTTSDLLTLDALEVARRIPANQSTSVLDIKRLASDISSHIHRDLTILSRLPPPRTIKTGDDNLDNLLGGGIHTQCITEFFGESGSGKTQLLLLLSLTSQLPPTKGGTSRPSIYISTESPLPTRRLIQINDALQTTTKTTTTDKVYGITCTDLESQEHIIRYQLPVMVERYDVGLVVIDSVAANFRAESSSSNGGRAAAAAGRGRDLVRMAQTLRGLAVSRDLAVVVSNQVSDRFPKEVGVGEGPVMGLDYQGRWFTGCGGEEEAGKVPALGMVWANLVGARVAVKKMEDPESGEWKRWMKVVYSPSCESGGECPFEIFEGGVRALRRGDGDAGGAAIS